MKRKELCPPLTWLATALLALVLAGPSLAERPKGCHSNTQCDDGIFCNGLEVCSAGSCEAAALPACGPGHVCDEETDTCRGRMEREQLWQTLWGAPTDEQTAIEIVDFNPRATSEGLLELRGLDGYLEAGTATLQAMHGTPTLYGHRAIEEDGETHGEVFVHYVAGQVLVAGRKAIAVDGLLITAEIGGAGATVMMVQDWGGSAERIHGRASAFHQASELTDGAIEPGSEKNGVPPAYLDDACWDGHPSYPGFTDCGRGYCQCFIDEVSTLIYGNIDCLTSLTGLQCLWDNLFPPNPLGFLFCILTLPFGEDACSEAIDQIVEHSNELDACKAESDTCFCASGDYPQYCDDAEVPIDIHVSGLRPGEYVEIDTRCWDPNTSAEKNETTRFEQDGYEIVTCLPDFLGEIEVSNAGVRNPSLPNQNGRQCTPEDYINPVDLLQYEQVEFDCSCDNFQDCPSFWTYASVTGLELGEQVQVSFAAHSPTGTEFFSATATTNLDQLVFESTTSGESWLWSGARISYFTSPSNDKCELNPLYDGNTPITPPPGTSAVKVAEITCGDSCSQQSVGGGNAEKSPGCNVAFRGIVTGNGARPVDVELEIDGLVYRPRITGAGTLIAQVPPGVAYSNVTLLNPIDVPAGSFCELTSAPAGQVPDQTPFLGVRIQCLHFGAPDIGEPFDDDTEDDGGLEDINGPNDWDGDYYCPPGQTSTSRVVPCPPGTCPPDQDACLCEEIIIESEPCYWTGLGSTVLSLDQPWIDGRVGGGAAVDGRIEVDQSLIVDVNAGDPNGLQAIIVMIGNRVEAVHHAGGHSLTSTGRLEIDTSGLPEGVHDVMVYALDNHAVAPLPGIARMQIEVSHAPPPCDGDDTGPTLSFATPAPGTTPPPGQLWISVAPDDPSDVSNVHFFVDGQMRHNDTSPPFGYTWWAGVGPHVLKARAFDHCGNVTEIEMPVSIADPCGGVEPASLAITNFTDGEWLDPGLYHVEAAVSDPDGVGIDHVEFQVGGFSPVTVTDPPWQSNGYYLLSEGDVDLQARVFDQCGRESVDQLTIRISENATVCSIDLGPPSVAITSPADGAMIAPGETTVETATSDDTVLFAGALWVDGQPEHTILSGFPDYQFPWLAGLGAHSLQVRATDVCWNVGYSQPVAVTADDGGPEGFEQPPIAPYVHVLEGTAYPAGPPIEGGRLVDFGILPQGDSPPARPITFVNDGNGDLVITGAQVVGAGFELLPTSSFPITVAPYAEAALAVRALTDVAGLFEATLDIESNATTPISIAIASRVRDKMPAFTDSFEAGDLTLWDIVQGAPMSVTADAALHGDLGARAELDGVAYNYARLLKNFGKSATFFRAQMFFDPSAVTIADGEYLHLQSAHGLGQVVAYTQARFRNGAWQARARVRLDDGTIRNSAWLPLDPGPVGLALEWQAAIDGQDDGYAKLSVVMGGSGEVIGTTGATVEVAQLDNDQIRAAKIYVGVAWGLASGTSGPLDLDHAALWY